MRGEGGGGSRRLLVLLASISIQLVPGLGDTPTSKDGHKAAEASKSSNKTGPEILFILLGLVAAVVLSVFLFKLWQKKKRAEQHARLLRLFEEDDELELELGLRD